MKEKGQQANDTHLEPAQTLTEVLAQLYIHLPLTHDVFA